MWLRYSCIRKMNLEHHNQQSGFCTCVLRRRRKKDFPDFIASSDLATLQLNGALKCLYWVTENPDITEQCTLRDSDNVVHSVFHRTYKTVFS